MLLAKPEGADRASGSTQSLEMLAGLLGLREASRTSDPREAWKG